MAAASGSTPPEILREFCRLSSPSEPSASGVDDQTWSDLDMDAVFVGLDRTSGVPGRMVLNRLLRSPTCRTETLADRDALIGALAPDLDTTRTLRACLASLDRTAGAEDLMRLLWEDPPSPLPFAWVYRLLPLLAVISVAVAVLVGKAALLGPLIAFALNTLVHFRTRRLWQREIQALIFAGALKACARRIEASSVPAAHRRRLATALRATRGLGLRLGLLSSGGLRDVLYEYWNVFLMLELRSYLWLVRRWPEVAPGLRELFVTLGELDALASVAVWRTERSPWCRPEWVAGAPVLEIEAGVHPLLEAPVPNSLVLAGRGCLITGANMSGKSTLLRVAGTNALLAQTVVTCTARRYRATPLRVVSSMRVADALLDGKSRYLAEAERLLVLVRRSDSGAPTLCLVDELLSGTNAGERLAASRAILGYLVRRQTLVLAATHDLELADRLASCYESYFFQDDFARNNADHRLRAGLAPAGNAIDLLERLGYPQEIVAEARAAPPPQVSMLKIR